MKPHLLATLLLAATVPASAQLYSFDPPGSAQTQAFGINPSGTVVGFYAGPGPGPYSGFVRSPQGTITPFAPWNQGDGVVSVNASNSITGNYFTEPSTPIHGYVLDPTGSVTTFDPAGSLRTIPNSINDSGAITGFYYSEGSSNSAFHGFVRDPEGNITSFDPPGSLATYAWGINDNGAIVGSYMYPDDGPYHGFVRDPEGNFTSFDPSGSVNTYARSINLSGAIAGYYVDASGLNHGFVRDPLGNITPFDPTGSAGTYAYSINPSGGIVGVYRDATTTEHGFIRDSQGNVTSFDPAGSLETYAWGINPSGVIAGYYNNGTNYFHGFVGRVPNTVDISQYTGAISSSVWQNAKQAGVSYAVVQAWNGDSPNSLAEGQLLGAQGSGLGTGASILLNYFTSDLAAYQIDEALLAMGPAATNLKFIVLQVEPCCGEFISWQPSTSYAKNSLIMDSANHIQIVTTAGESGATIPAWNNSGGVTFDGTVEWQDTGAVVLNQVDRLARISAAVATIQAYKLPQGVVIYTNGPNGGWQTITGNCGTGSANNCSALISLPLWDVENTEFYGGDGLLHCGDGVAGLVPFTPYSPTTWQARAGNQYDFGFAASATVTRACSGDTGLFGLPSTLDLDYFAPTLFQ